MPEKIESFQIDVLDCRSEFLPGRRVDYIAIANGIVAGHLVLREIDHRPSEAWITDLFVREEFRRKGVGRSLVIRVLNEARRLMPQTVCVSTGIHKNNEASQGLFGSLGFVRGEQFLQVAEQWNRSH